MKEMMKNKSRATRPLGYIVASCTNLAGRFCCFLFSTYARTNERTIDETLPFLNSLTVERTETGKWGNMD